MSRYRAFGDPSRFDSAADLSYGQPGTDHDDLEDSETVAASSVMAPWSEYNTRLGSDYLSPYTPTEWPSDSYTLNEPIPRCTSPGAATSASCSSSPSTSLPHTYAAASSATAYSAIPSSRHSDHNTVLCEHCSQSFTGKFRQRNLTRHVQQKHIDANGHMYTCSAKGCDKVFKRQDARLKHARNKHPELNLPPVQRRHGTEHDATDPHVFVVENIDLAQEPPYNVGQWLQAGQRSTDTHATKMQHEVDTSASVEESPQAVRCVFTTFQMNLHPSDYSRVCDSFFTRWESIVQQLRDVQSTEYPVYAKALEDIHAAVHAIDVTAYGTCATGSNSYRNRAPHTQRAGARGNRRSEIDHSTGVTSQTDRVSKRGRKQSAASGSGQHLHVALDEHGDSNDSRKVDCPVYKHNRMHGAASTCRGCSVGVMSQVRSHLNPNRTRTHGGFPGFIAQCSRCKQDFVGKSAYDAHNSQGCTSQPQTRNDIVIAWSRQYLAIYPDADQIPIPWTDEDGWLSESELRRCRASYTNPTVSSPFLGERQSPRSSRPQTPPAIVNPPDRPAYDGAMDHMLQDAMNPTFIQTSRSSTPTLNGNRQNAVTPQLALVGTAASDNQHFLDIVRSFRIHQRAIRRGATHLTTEQLFYMSEECELMANITRGMYQHSSQPTHAQIPTLSPRGPTTETDYPVHTTPLRSGHLTGNDNSHFVTPDASTQPSTRSYRTGSSQYVDPTFTQSSSTSDPRFLTPDSSTNHRRRRISVPSPIRQDTVYLRRGVSSRLSLPDDSSSDEYDNQYYDTVRRSTGRRS